MPDHADLTKVHTENLPEYLHRYDLKPKLSWLYFQVFSEFPIVRSNFADVVISVYSRRYIFDAENIKVRLFEDAMLTQETYPNTLMAMHEMSKFGSAYTIFSTPACFFLPALLFGDVMVSLPPFDYLLPVLKKSISPWYDKDKEIA